MSCGIRWFSPTIDHPEQLFCTAAHLTLTRCLRSFVGLVWTNLQSRRNSGLWLSLPLDFIVKTHSYSIQWKTRSWIICIRRSSSGSHIVVETLFRGATQPFCKKHNKRRKKKIYSPISGRSLKSLNSSHRAGKSFKIMYCWAAFRDKIQRSSCGVV